MGDLVSSNQSLLVKLNTYLVKHLENLNTVLNLNHEYIRVDHPGSLIRDGFFLTFSPTIFFIITCDNQNMKLQLMTYNEQVFDSYMFSVDRSEDLSSCLLQLLQKTYTYCTGVKRENVKKDKLKEYLNDEETLFERFGENLIFRSVECRRVNENQTSLDLCDTCKQWLISKETNFSTNDLDDNFYEDDNYVPSNVQVKLEEIENTAKFKQSNGTRKARGAKKRKKEKINSILDFFSPGDDDANNTSVCNLCSCAVDTRDKNISSLIKHFTKMHPDSDVVRFKKEFCEYCGKRFQIKSNLIKHMKAEHASEYKKFKCPVSGCNEKFRIDNGKLMRNHLECVHGQKRAESNERFPCEKCNKKFKTFDIMQKHMKGVHEAKHVPCYICAKLVKEGTPMDHHIKYVHERPNQFE